MNGGSYKISSYNNTVTSNCNALLTMLQGRPISIAVSAGSTYWQSYQGGILNVCGTGVDHGVQLVGAFQNSTVNYWLVKNSWSTQWGENGYIRIDRSVSSGNLCGICTYPQYPIL